MFSAKGRTTVPLAVRRVLGLRVGDVLLWRIEADGRVTVRRAARPGHPFACFDEWAGEADSRAYAGL